MAGGETNIISPIVAAIRRAESGTTGEIRVHLSKRWFERDPMARARKLFTLHGMELHPKKNAVLVYLNLRRKRFAIFGDDGINAHIDQKLWNELAAQLRSELHSTHIENAIASAVLKIGETLAHYFPAKSGSHNAPSKSATHE